MVERLYVPSAYVDEVTPPGRASPDAWIGAAAGDVWLLATARGCDLGLTLRPGEIVLFVWVEDLGCTEVEIRADGSYQARGPVPAGGTHFWVRLEPDTLADSLDELVAFWHENAGASAGDETVSVQVDRWSPDDIPYQFDVGAHGPRFICPPPEAAAGRGGVAP